MGVLTVVVGILALVDGLIHLGLDVFALKVFSTGKWNMFSILWLLQFLGAIALVAALIVSERASLAQRRIVGALLAIYPAITFLAWIYFTHGRGNPMNFATVDKPLEVILVILAIVRVVQLGQSTAAQGMTSAARG